MAIIPNSLHLVIGAAGGLGAALARQLAAVGEPEDVAGMIAYLLSPAAGRMTGQVVGVDGGLGVVRGR